MKTDLDKALAFFDKANTTLESLSGDTIPKGFFTAKQFAQAKPLNEQNMKARLDRMVVNSLAEVRVFRLNNGNKAAHYRILG